MKSLRHASVITAACLTAAAIIIAPEAKAETVTFGGDVSESCTLGTPSGTGNLGTNAGNTTLGTGQTGGTKPTLAITCNAASTVTITSLTQTGGTTLSGLTGYAALATVTAQAGLETADTSVGGTGTFVFGADNTTEVDTLEVEFTVSTTDPIPADSYTFTVEVTVAPNP